MSLPTEKMLGKMVIHHACKVDIKDGKMVSGTDRRIVKLMAVSGVYAMVRRPRCIPYVAELKDIEQ